MALRSRLRWSVAGLASAVSLAIGTPPVLAQQGAIEEVVVTGSYIRGTPEDAASPVTVMSRDEMNYTGNPSVFEMVRNLGPVTGVDGETNQFQSNGLEGSSNINLRGLGPGRTLVLMNGKRIVPNPYAVGESGQQFVNINQIPAIALERVELLKDGASATYGSDAVAGVANFITRSDFRGLEIMGSYTDIDESDGDYQANAILGFGTDRLDVVISGGWQHRSELSARDVDFINEIEPVIGRRGYSSVPNPVRLINVVPQAAVPLANDPDCEAVGGQLDAAGACNFRFTPFDNLTEEEDHYQAMVEATFRLNDNFELNGSVLYAYDDVPEWKTSPSYPPQQIVDPTRFVGPGIPHWDDLVERHPEIGAAFPAGALVLGRTFGVSGPPAEGYRELETLRLSFGVSGELDNGVTVDSSITWGEAKGERGTPDTRIDNLAYAYRGLIGPDCDPAAGVPGSGNLGTGDCYYYNPFTSGYRVSQAPGFEGTPSPGFTGDETLLNHPDMRDWLTEVVGSETKNTQTVFDLVFSGDSGVEAGGGTVGWAAGVQWRHDELDVELFENTDLTVTPCPFGLQPGETDPVFNYTCSRFPTGPFHFLAGALPESDSQDVWAVFGELVVPLTDRVELQLATRYENYSGDVGDTLDPKAAIRWDVTDQVSLRGSVTTSFRGPSLNQLGGRGTTLQFVAPANAFKAIDTEGNPELQPEQALTTNLGVVWQPTENVFASLDYWRFAFEEPIVIEPFNDIIALSTSDDPELRDFAQSRIDYAEGRDGDPAGIERVVVTYTNGPEITTDGFDYKLQWDIPTEGAGTFTVGTEGTYINRYRVGAWTFAESFDAAGRLNRETYVRPLPEWKNDLWLNWSFGGHNLRADLYYTSEYDDTGVPAGFDEKIDDHLTLDLHYNFYFNDDLTRLFVSVYNVTDEDPPRVLHELDYDPYTHSPYGRMIKLGIQHDFGGLFR